MSIETIKLMVEAIEADLKLFNIPATARMLGALNAGRRAIAESQKNELEACVKEFFEKYLNCVEESDSGKEFHPITIGCCRAFMLEPLNNLLDKMAQLSGAKGRKTYDLR